MNSKMLVIAGAMTLAAFASAQEAPFGPAKGVKTASISGAFNNVSGGGATVKMTNLQLSVGYFFTNSLEGSLAYGYTNLDVEGSSVKTTDLRVGVKYYLNSSNELTMEQPFHPFVGLHYAYNKLEAAGSVSPSGFGASIGGDYFFSPNVSFTPVVTWSRQRAEGTDLDNLGIGLGFTVWFK